MFRVPLPGWQPSPQWAIRWVAVYVGVILAVIAVGAVMFGPGERSPFGDEWQGTSAGWRQASHGSEAAFLLSADEAPHLDVETGLPVGRRANWGGANRWDRAYAVGWNRQMRERLSKSGAPRRFDGTDTDGASILQRFERRAAEVVEVPPWIDADSYGRARVSVGAVTVTLAASRNCMVPGTFNVRGRQVDYPGSAWFRRIEPTSRSWFGGGMSAAWIPRCETYRALLSEDARTLWLVGPGRNSNDRPTTWTAAIDVATGFTVGVDFVEGP